MPLSGGFTTLDVNGKIKIAATGAVGPIGVAGVTGSNGINGINGSNGFDGDDGLDGVSIPGRAVQVYEQALEPTGAFPGDFWITPA